MLYNYYRPRATLITRCSRCVYFNNTPLPSLRLSQTPQKRPEIAPLLSPPPCLPSSCPSYRALVSFERRRVLDVVSSWSRVPREEMDSERNSRRSAPGSRAPVSSYAYEISNNTRSKITRSTKEFTTKNGAVSCVRFGGPFSSSPKGK